MSASASRVSSQRCWRVKEAVQLSDVVAVALAAGPLGVQVSQVALQNAAVDLGKAVHAGTGTETAEAAQRAQAPANGLQVQLRGQPPTHPSLGQVPQPRLADLLEAELLVAFPASRRNSQTSRTNSAPLRPS